MRHLALSTLDLNQLTQDVRSFHDVSQALILTLTDLVSLVAYQSNINETVKCCDYIWPDVAAVILVSNKMQNLF